MLRRDTSSTPTGKGRVATQETRTAPTGRPGGLGPWTTLAVVVGLLVFPLANILLLPRLFLGPDAVARLGRAAWWGFIVWTLLWEWGLFFLIRAALRRDGRTLRDIGFPRPGRAEVAIVGTVLAALAIAGFLTGGGRPPASVGAGLAWLLPAAPLERVVWVPVCMTAGICEETIFRGMGITELRSGPLRVGGAVIVTSLAFVLAHGLHQGWGYASRGAIALILAGLFLRRKNLRAPIYLHALIDLAALLAV